VELSTESVLRCFYPGSTECGTLVVTLVKLDKWAESVLALGLESALGGIAHLSGSIDVIDLIKLIAQGLTRHGRGLQADILGKSIQETLFDSTGIEDELTLMEFERRLKRFLRRRGLTGFVQLFLSLHVFNVVWFDTSETFRATADSTSSFLREMQTVKRNCRKIVHSVKGALHPLTRSSAEKLTVEISLRLQELGYGLPIPFGNCET